MRGMPVNIFLSSVPNLRGDTGSPSGGLVYTHPMNDFPRLKSKSLRPLDNTINYNIITVLDTHCDEPVLAVEQDLKYLYPTEDLSPKGQRLNDPLLLLRMEIDA
jgi:hypothetical protein